MGGGTDGTSGLGPSQPVSEPRRGPGSFALAGAEGVSSPHPPPPGTDRTAPGTRSTPPVPSPPTPPSSKVRRSWPGGPGRPVARSHQRDWVRHRQKLQELFCRSPDQAIFRACPGPGRRWRRACWRPGEPTASACSGRGHEVLVGSGPGHRPERQKDWVHWRLACPKFLRQTFHEFAGQSILWSPWARPITNKCASAAWIITRPFAAWPSSGFALSIVAGKTIRFTTRPVTRKRCNARLALGHGLAPTFNRGGARLNRKRLDIDPQMSSGKKVEISRGG